MGAFVLDKISALVAHRSNRCKVSLRTRMSSSATNSNLFHAVRGVKLCEAFELFCRWRQQNALLAIFH